MNDYVIYLKVEPYLAQWLINSFGNPVELIRDSPESKLVKRFLDIQPQGIKPDLGHDANISVIIPFSKDKDPRTYNYLSPRAKKMLAESFYSIFINNLWTELGDLENIHCSITDVIYAWLEKHGIDECHWECVRQKYFRIRKKYREKRIKLQ